VAFSVGGKSGRVRGGIFRNIAKSCACAHAARMRVLICLRQDHVQQRFASLRQALKAMLYSHSSQTTESKVSLFAFRKFLKTVGVSASIQVQ
jgi:hypothetical protein